MGGFSRPIEQRQSVTVDNSISDKMRKQAMSESIIKWLTAVACLACIVSLNHEQNAVFAHPLRSLIIVRRVARLKRKCAVNLPQVGERLCN